MREKQLDLGKISIKIAAANQLINKVGVSTNYFGLHERITLTAFTVC